MFEDVFLVCCVLFFGRGSSISFSRCIVFWEEGGVERKFAKIFQTLDFGGVFHYCRSRSMKCAVFALPLGLFTAVPNIGLFTNF